MRRFLVFFATVLFVVGFTRGVAKAGPITIIDGSTGDGNFQTPADTTARIHGTGNGCPWDWGGYAGCSPACLCSKPTTSRIWGGSNISGFQFICSNNQFAILKDNFTECSASGGYATISQGFCLSCCSNLTVCYGAGARGGCTNQGTIYAWLCGPVNACGDVKSAVAGELPVSGREFGGAFVKGKCLGCPQTVEDTPSFILDNVSAGHHTLDVFFAPSDLRMAGETGFVDNVILTANPNGSSAPELDPDAVKLPIAVALSLLLIVVDRRRQRQ